jgi:hypothetical protein
MQNGCAGESLAVGRTCSITVSFAPQSKGLTTAALQVTTTALDSPTIQIPISGIGFGKTFSQCQIYATAAVANGTTKYTLMTQVKPGVPSSVMPTAQ